jgi:hypothetical protein
MFSTPVSRVEIIYPFRDSGATTDPPQNIWIDRVRRFNRDMKSSLGPTDDTPHFISSSFDDSDYPWSIVAETPGAIDFVKRVEPDGTVRRVYVMASNQPRALDYYFAQRFRHDRWKPAVRNGVAVAALVQSGSVIFSSPESRSDVIRRWVYRASISGSLHITLLVAAYMVLAIVTALIAVRLRRRLTGT